MIQTLDEKAREISTALMARSAEIAATFGAKADEVDAVLGGRAAAIAETLNGQVTQFEERVVNRLAAVSGNLDETSREVSENLAARTREIDQTLGLHTGNINAALDREAGQLEQVLAGRAGEIRETIAQAVEDLDTTLAGRAGEIGDGLAQRIGEISAALADRLADLEGTLGERGQALQAALTARSSDLHGLFDTRGVQLVEALSALGNQISREVMSLGETTTQTIEGQTSAAVRHLGEKQNEFVAAIEHSAAHLRTSIETGAAASIEALAETNERLRTGMAEVIERLANSSEALQQAIGATGTDFAAAEQSLSNRMDDFRSILTRFAGEIDQFNQSTRATINEAGSLAETIARHRESLASSTGDLSRQQGELDYMLGARRDSLESLVASIKERRDELEGLMQSFASHIDDSFEKAAAGARDIGALLAETSQSTGGMIDRQFSGIRTNIEEERESLAVAMRAACEQANAELEGILGQTTERFQSSAAELRGMSREIQRELESTREALRRGAVELPQETAQQAASMRRAVADQIKALEELNEIVTKSGRAYDVSQPAPVSAGRAAQPVSPRRVEPARVAVDLPRAQEPARAEPQRARLATPPVTAKTSERGAGWISDLLARVDSDEPSDSPNPVAQNPTAKSPAQAQKLETISLDVAQMIDHAAAASAWDRYRHGEVNAFSKRIYTGRGTQTFDEIRRRYRLDPEFRATVDRYVQEFDRLLSGLGQDESSDAVAKTYLLSETGKVYTLLAHAAGKLG